MKKNCKMLVALLHSTYHRSHDVETSLRALLNRCSFVSRKSCL